MNTAPYISVVVPVFGCSTSIHELYYRLVPVLTKINSYYEIILVNDASPDGAWEAISEICNFDKSVIGLSLSRNFGQHYAITAGLNYARGEWVVVMDCDLQDQPEEISALYSKAKDGYDSVFAQRLNRNDKYIKRLLSKLFYSIFSYLTGTKQDPSVANFGVYHKKVIDAVLKMGDHIRYFPTMVQWVGFKKCYLPVKHAERSQGKSSYNFKKLIFLAINTILAFSDKPLRLTVKIGFIITFISFSIAIIYFILYRLGIVYVLGFTSLILSLWFLAGVVVSILGILGLYIGRIFENVKQRPTFIINEKINI